MACAVQTFPVASTIAIACPEWDPKAFSSIAPSNWRVKPVGVGLDGSA